MDEDWEDHDWTAKAAGGLRGMMLGVFRVITRPAQMKVLIWFAKRRWKNKGKVTPAMSPGDLAASVGMECVIGATMYDVYGVALGKLDVATQNLNIPIGKEYVPVFGAGVAAGVASAVMTTPHNNIVAHHADTRKGIWRAFTHLGWKHPFQGGIFDGVRHAVVRDSVAMSVMFVSTAWFKKNLPQPSDTVASNAAHSFLAGGLAGMVSTMAVMPFRNAHAWGTQYPGTYFFLLAPRMLSSPSSTLNSFKMMVAGMPPALLAAFIPNAFGMAAFSLANQLNKELEEIEDTPKAKSA